MADNTTELDNAHIVVTDSNLNPIIQIITWILLAAATLMLSFRLLSKHFLRASRVLGWEDVFIFWAFVRLITGFSCMFLTDDIPKLFAVG
jgi:hypothetical protein